MESGPVLPADCSPAVDGLTLVVHVAGVCLRPGWCIAPFAGDRADGEDVERDDRKCDGTDLFHVHDGPPDLNPKTILWIIVGYYTRNRAIVKTSLVVPYSLKPRNLLGLCR